MEDLMLPLVLSRIIKSRWYEKNLTQILVFFYCKPALRKWCSPVNVAIYILFDLYPHLQNIKAQ